MKNRKKIGRLDAINISLTKGTSKKEIIEAEFLSSFGIKNDAHGGSYREISVLCYEDIDKFSRLTKYKLKNGDFGENLIISGIGFDNISIGVKLRIGETLNEVIQIGKECHSGCIIQQTTGFCIMPENGFFLKVIKGGKVKKGDIVELIY